MNTADFATPLAAFIAGMATSVHCAVMCGPLGCALLGTRSATPSEARRVTLCYHAARVLSYAAAGSALGTLGSAAGDLFHTPLSRALPWAMALLFVAIAFGWERWLPRLPFLSRWMLKLNFRSTSLSRYRAAMLLGGVTPFLPCGPLYLAFGVALVSGSGIAGAALMGSFAGGTIPLYALAQIGALRWQGRLTPRVQLWTRRVLALGSAMLIGGRTLLHDGSLASPLQCLLCR